jgi:hypothetical protein
MGIDDDGFRERLRVAYHEAGHAVVGMHFGMEIDRVKINPEGGGYYRPGWEGSVTRYGGREYTLMLLAGRLAEEIATGEPREANDDWLRRVLKRLRAGDAEIADHDDAKVLSMFLVGGDSDDLAIEEYRALEAEAKKLLAEPSIQAGIEAAARALLRQPEGEMGSEAMTIVDDTEDEDAPSEGAERRREWERLERTALLVEPEASGQLAADEDEPM